MKNKKLIGRKLIFYFEWQYNGQHHVIYPSFRLRMEIQRSDQAFTTYCDCSAYRKYVSIIYCTRSKLLKMDAAMHEAAVSEDDDDDFESLASEGDADNEGESKVSIYCVQLKRRPTWWIAFSDETKSLYTKLIII